MNKRVIGALLMALPVSAVSLCFGKTQRADANSAPPYWYGSDSAGAVLTGDTCPIQVTHETLTLTVPSLDMSEGFGTVTAEYELYNPTEEDITAKIVFPMGVRAEYVGVDTDLTDGEYSITAGGEPVGYTLRYTRNNEWLGGTSFDIDEGIRQLYPEENAFYSDDTPVYVHTFDVTVPYLEERETDWVNFAIEFEASPKTTRVFGAEPCNYNIHNGNGQIIKGYQNQEGSTRPFTFYAVGEDVNIVAQKAYRFSGNQKTVDEGARFVERPIAPTTFKALVGELCEKNGVQDFEEDWRAGFTSMLEDEEYRYKQSCMCVVDPSAALKRSDFLCWYEYSLTVPAKETLVNIVSAPLFPTVDKTYSQTLYKFAYLLSPASKWASFGGIDIAIETPYFLSDGSFDFKREESGTFTYSRNSLPMGELTFTLTEEKRMYPQYDPMTGDDVDEALVTAIVLLCVAAAAVAVIITVTVKRNKKRRLARDEEERRLRMGRPEEGKVDLPPDPIAPPSEDEPASDESTQTDGKVDGQADAQGGANRDGDQGGSNRDGDQGDE